MDPIDQAEVAYANALYQRGAAITYARHLGEPIAHHRMVASVAVDGEVPVVPLRTVVYQKQPSLRDHRTAPMWMNVGFGIELGLKGLYLYAEHSSPPYGHNTHKFFGLLNSRDQAAIEAELHVILNELEAADVIPSEADKSGLTVERTLERFGSDFTDFRYIHEGNTLPARADTGLVRLRAPSVWFSLDAILRVLQGRLLDTGCEDIQQLPFEPLASASL